MGDSTIPDSHVTASSYLIGFEPIQARYRRNDSYFKSWCTEVAFNEAAYEWLQVSLLNITAPTDRLNILRHV
jgi:hypothetical protein